MTVTLPSKIWVGYPDAIVATWTKDGLPGHGGYYFYADGVKLGYAASRSNYKAYYEWRPARVGPVTITVEAFVGSYHATSEPVTVTVLLRPEVTITASPEALQTGGGTADFQVSLSSSAGGVLKWKRLNTWGTWYDPFAQSPVDASGASSLTADIEAGGSWFQVGYYPAGRDDQLAGGSAYVSAPLASYISVQAYPEPVIATETVVTIETETRKYARNDSSCVRGSTLTFTDTFAGGRSILGQGPTGCYSTFQTRFATPGTHTIEIAWGGDEETASTSTTLTLEVLPDTFLRASGVGTDLAKFYPVEDGYIDTLAIRANRQEPVGADIRITNAAGRKVRTWSKPVAAGKYQVAWNGRTASGTLVPPGRYKIVQTLRRSRRQHSRVHQLHDHLAQALGLAHQNGHPERRRVQGLRPLPVRRGGQGGLVLRPRCSAPRERILRVGRGKVGLHASRGTPIWDAQVRGPRCGGGLLRSGLLRNGVEGRGRQQPLAPTVVWLELDLEVVRRPRFRSPGLGSGRGDR